MKKYKYMAFAICFCLNSCNGFFDGGVDYIISSGTFPSSLTVGTNASLVYSIKNQGSQDSTIPPAVEVYLSGNYYYDNTAILITTDYFSDPLEASQEIEKSTSVFIPANAVTPGYIMLKVVTTESETDTNNNISTSSILNISGGIQFRNNLPVDNIFHDLSISASTTDYYYFDAIQLHAYQVFWDDFSEGFIYAGEGVDVSVSGMSGESPTTTFFSQLNNGFAVPGTMYASTTQAMYLNVYSGSWGGGYAIKVSDIGVPPDLTITDLSTSYTGNNKLTITYTVANIGPGDTGSNCINTGFLWNGVIPSAGGSSDYIDPICQIIPANTGFIDKSVVINLDTNPGVVKAYVDIDQSTAESNESNNLW